MGYVIERLGCVLSLRRRRVIAIALCRSDQEDGSHKAGQQPERLQSEALVHVFGFAGDSPSYCVASGVAFLIAECRKLIQCRLVEQ